MTQWLRRVAFYSTLVVGSGVLSAQPTIVGPTQGSPGQVLSFQLMAVNRRTRQQNGEEGLFRIRSAVLPQDRVFPRPVADRITGSATRTPIMGLMSGFSHYTVP